ncbi:hypothetical protein TWF481_010327 [Arthrobotrys musiformis]|uniref:Carboxylesterase type B domain-containing protein n=1 Tax=Arthrobotrys musiformis TaxID=47236 RepID=A0AAV9W1U6_9PEZI
MSSKVKSVILHSTSKSELNIYLLTMIRYKIIIFLYGLIGVSGNTVSPAVAGLDSALTILKDNDLYAQYTTRTSDGILVEAEKPFLVAHKACESLGESLWNPEIESFSAGLNNSLLYQKYLGKFSAGQQFWVGSAGNTCQAIDFKGRFQTLDCHRKLPAICTQSAPLSNLSFVDTSPRFHITKAMGDQTLTGYRDINSWRFFGIRFSAAPQRFGYSSVYSGKGHAMAIDEPARCLQNLNSEAVGSEDCLFLNLWTPYLPGKRITKKDLKPVMFWLYGGGNVVGTISDPGADCGNFVARGDVVCVGINYRLGNFGWLAADNTTITGNYALSDMVTGLKWVQKYIKYFGGDPARVTIMGESAGAAGVRALLASKTAKGLFHAAIMESQPVGYIPHRWYAEYRTIAEHTSAFGVLEAVNCTSASDKVACLRATDASTLTLLPADKVANYPVIDNKFLESNGLQVTGKGFINSVPTMIGATRDESAIALGPLPRFTNLTESLALISSLLTQDITAAANSPAFSLPPGDLAEAVFNATVRVATDGTIKCLGLATAYSAAKHKTLPSIYAFEFNRTYSPPNYTSSLCSPPITPEFPLGDANQEYYKCHAGEVILVFGTVLRLGLPDRDGLDIPFSQAVIDHWASFMWRYDPNPNPAYLKARGYFNTLNQISLSGKWETVKPKRPELRVLQWDSLSIPFSEGPQCAALGYPLNYYEAYL